MNSEDKTYWKSFREVKRTFLTNDEYLIVCEIYARLKSQKAHYPCKSCGSSAKVLQEWIDFINLEYDNETRK